MELFYVVLLCYKLLISKNMFFYFQESIVHAPYIQSSFSWKYPMLFYFQKTYGTCPIHSKLILH